MVPLGQVFDKLARVVRQIARDAKQGDPPRDHRRRDRGRQADRRRAERSADAHDPQRHRSRHRVPTSGARSSASPRPARSALNAYQKGNHVADRGRDDGAGIDPQKLLKQGRRARHDRRPTRRARRLARGHLQPDLPARLQHHAKQVTDLSGRGVGMDVVKTNIRKLGGVIDSRARSATARRSRSRCRSRWRSSARWSIRVVRPDLRDSPRQRARSADARRDARSARSRGAR